MSSEVQVLGDPVERGDEILTPEALAFLAGLHDAFAGRRDELLQARSKRREEARTTGRLDFLPETKEIREGDWQVAGAPAALRDRRVEITGPTDRKMTINALNSGAKVWLADLEDANTPHWANVVSGQVNLYDAIRETITLEIDCPPDVPNVFADASHLDSALVNLALNSRDAMPRGGILKISASEERVETQNATKDVAAGRYVVFSVRDSGSTFAACNISLRASPRIKEMRELTWWPLPVRGELVQSRAP